MPNHATAEEINEAKANMDHIYGEADPRAYFRELSKVDYAIPDAAKPIFAALAGHLHARDGGRVTMLDLGCSYGVNAALLKHDLAMADLYDHWGAEPIGKASTDQVIEADRLYFDGLDRAEPPLEVIGLDPSAPAIAYGERSSLLDRGYALNLEEEALPAAAARAIGAVDLVVSTGCVGYITERTFDRVLAAAADNRAPWLANFVLRMFPFDAIAESFAASGYVTEKLAGAQFVQRAFVSHDEQRAVIDQLESLGLDSETEAGGALVAEFYLSRPADEAETPVADLLAA